MRQINTTDQHYQSEEAVLAGRLAYKQTKTEDVIVSMSRQVHGVKKSGKWTNDQPYSLLSALLLLHFQEYINCLHSAPASSSNSIMVLWHQQSLYTLSMWTEMA